MTVSVSDPGLVAELRAAVHGACADLGGVSCVRAIDAARAPGFHERAWQVLGQQIGLGGIGLSEQAGGMGGLAEILAVSEELGGWLMPVPFLTSTVMGGQVLMGCRSPDAVALLPSVASGDTILATAVTGPDGRWDPSRTPFAATDDLLTGTAPAVADGLAAQWLIAAAGESLFLVDLRENGQVEPVAGLDLSRSSARIALDRAPGVLLTSTASLVVPACLNIFALALAAEQLGGAQACLDATVDFAKTRYQFGRAIGSFQAVKHTLADLLVSVEMARSAVLRGLDARDADELAEAALVARIWCSEAYRHVSADAVQLHGGIGFTWEHDAHLYFRRARADAVLSRGVADAREALATLLRW